jgi:pilus assembly protein Flp/PilA
MHMTTRTILSRLLNDRQGATTVEYGMILAFIVLAIIASMSGVADKTTGLWASVAHSVTEAQGSTRP